jgi:hypothetical protein
MTNPTGNRAAQALYEAMALRMDNADKIVNANTTAITQMGNRIDGLISAGEAQGKRIDNLTAATERLERSIVQLVAGINAQRETMQQMMTQQAAFLVLATKQAETIGDMAKGKAA